MYLRRYVSQKFFIMMATGIIGIALLVLLPGQGESIQPGTEQEQPPPMTQTPNENVPNIPGRRPERPIPSSQPSSRAITEQPRMQTQKRWADNFLPQSVWHVTDPQDGLRKDGRVAVLEGLNARVVYLFYKEQRVINDSMQPDLTIYTHEKAGLEGPYDVFVSNFGDSTWIPLGTDITGTASFDLPPSLESIELVLITNRHNGATYIEAVEGVTLAGGAMQGTFSYFPESLIGLRVDYLDCAELERAQAVLGRGGGGGYQVVPLGEIEVKWNNPIKNEWKIEEFHIEAEGEYEVYASDSRGMETFIGRRAGAQSIDLPQDMIDAARVRIRNHNGNRPIIIYSIVGRR
ncbi:hypothetical protein GF339_00330 [candidate division KSB3 bacterium]|uniref:Uncharacterized protein n=1 Tax=candidate division KSB3 bacterium TaxID=2044937 RepID=A0A9D5Q3Y8_9BACT|nr:hypothetical protein [candidate division KSB3 bacterium]MBD3322995.1 hypothetical protein [candidate division KSB3 bacterium]